MSDATRTSTRDCTKCRCGLYELVIDDATGKVIAAICNMCGDDLKLSEPEPLTLDQAGHLSDLIRGVDRGAKLRYYPRGAEGSAVYGRWVMRAFTLEGGGLYPNGSDIREAYIWGSGITERWFKVSDLIIAMSNIFDGKHGMDKPMATIDYGDSASSSDKG